MSRDITPEQPAAHARPFDAAALVVSAIVALLVAADFEWMSGQHAATVIAIANLLGLFVLGLTATVAGRTRPPAEEPAPAPPAADSDDVGDVVAKIDALMRTQQLFRDANLNLNRLARKAGLPARSISVAVNRVRAKNVSQYITATGSPRPAGS